MIPSVREARAMLGVSLFIMTRSARNRALARLRRLRQPRYWLGALAGLAYLYFAFFRVGGVRPPSDAGDAPPPEIVVALLSARPTIAACLVAVLVAVAWIVPLGAGLLEFSRAEVLFLAPAPVRRQWLLVHRLLRSQLGLLVAAAVPALLLGTGGAGPRLRFALALWIVLVTLRLYFTGVSLARPRLAHPEPRARSAARLPLLLSVGAVIGVADVVRGWIAEGPVGSLDEFVDRIGALGHPGTIGWLLAPFGLVVRPLFDDTIAGYGVSLVGSLALLGATLLWVLKSDKAIEQATDVVVERHDTRALTQTRERYRMRPAPWALAPRGSVEGVFVWKSAIEAVRSINPRVVFSFVFPFTTFVVLGTATAAFPNGLVQVIASAGLLTAGFTTGMGPQIVRSDLRRDLVHLDVIKTWPVAPSSLIRGATLWPTVSLTGVSWLGLVIAAMLSPRAFPEVSTPWTWALALSAMVATPALILAQLVLHNGAALLFPAWVSLGGHRPRGLDAIGQRLITLGGTWLGLGLLTVPGALLGAVVWYALAPWLGPAALAPAALAGALFMAIEVYGLTIALGPAFDRLDLTDMERAE